MHDYIKEYLKLVYKNNFASSSMNQSGDLVYGELYYDSFLKILDLIQLNKKDVFLDIGSGLGKLLLQTFFLTEAKSIYGVELDKSRHKAAEKALNKVKENFPNWFETDRKIELIQKDFTKTNLQDVTVAYTCCTIFSEKLLLSVGGSLNKLKNLKTIISFRKLENLKNKVLTNVLQLDGTWDTACCYIYRDIKNVNK